MRPDFAKVVTERPRVGLRLKDRKGRKRDMQKEVSSYNNSSCEDIIHNDDSVEQKGEKIRFKWIQGFNDGKQFTDVLGPLCHYLLKQVGRPWDDVYSEICKNLPANNTNTSHVRDHVWDFVEDNVIMVDGKPYDSKGDEIFQFRPFNFYIHPETGILCKIDKEPRKKWKRKQKIGIDVPGEDLKQYHKIEGIWYILTLEKPKSFHEYDSEYDVARKKYLTYWERHRIYGGNYVGCGKRQLNSKEIKKANL